MSPHDALDDLRPVSYQMPAIRNRQGIGRASFAARRIPFASVARDDFDARASFQPRLKCFGLPVRQQVNDTMRFEINEDRAIVRTFAVRIKLSRPVTEPTRLQNRA